MDYLAHPCPPSKHFDTFPLLFDLENARAVVVEDGSHPVVFTASADVAKVVARAIDYPEPWTVEGGIVGHRTSYKEIVQIAEKVTGKVMGNYYYAKPTILQSVTDNSSREKFHHLQSKARGS